MRILLFLLGFFSFMPAAFGAQAIWIHPEVRAAINKTQVTQSTRRSMYSVVDGVARPTGYAPQMEQYEGATFRSFPVWSGRTAGQEIPKELDYTKVAPPNVVNQQCGDCWAQGAAMAFEGVIGWLDKASRDISRQAIIDCSDYGSCFGGYISVGFFKEPKGAVHTADYPYLGRNQKCQKQALTYREQARATGFIRGEDGKKPTVQDYQRAMMEKGPIEGCGASVSLGGFDQDGFIAENRRGRTDHCWAVYGWLDGETHGKPPGAYFIFVNSWGRQWAKDGIVYLRVSEDGVNLNGGALTEAAFIDYKDAPPTEPVTFTVEASGVLLTATVAPNELYTADEAKLALTSALNALGEL